MIASEIPASRRFASWRFAQLTAVILVYLLLAPLLAEMSLMHVVAQIVLLNTLFVTFSASTEISRRVRVVLWSACLVPIVAGGIESLSASDSWRNAAWYVELFSAFLLQSSCVVGILRYIARSDRITLDNIFAAVVAYMLIAIVFALIYLAAWDLDPKAFNLPAELTARTESSRITMIYFSFVTLATLGYGDITAINPFVRMIAVIQAMVGQFYVAILVGILIGLFISHSSAARTSK